MLAGILQFTTQVLIPSCYIKDLVSQMSNIPGVRHISSTLQLLYLLLDNRNIFQMTMYIH